MDECSYPSSRRDGIERRRGMRRAASSSSRSVLNFELLLSVVVVLEDDLVSLAVPYYYSYLNIIFLNELHVFYFKARNIRTI